MKVINAVGYSVQLVWLINVLEMEISDCATFNILYQRTELLGTVN